MDTITTDKMYTFETTITYRLNKDLRATGVVVTKVITEVATQVTTDVATLLTTNKTGRALRAGFPILTTDIFI